MTEWLSDWVRVSERDRHRLKEERWWEEEAEGSMTNSDGKGKGGEDEVVMMDWEREWGEEEGEIDKN